MWTKHLWCRSWEAGTILQEDPPNLSLQHQNDAFIMLEFAKAGMKGERLDALNRCRMFLEVTILSDIVTGDGSQILMN
eukprot:CAMPEP_0185733360 /NCGR_PEP_ID=MMETSP1171-20130828/19255_1 /TAXON_ID=374046 /ORGANISM="Helicotheca tamensis, Strain CCMP826" /LENGTH=77 /DNA_ID=CAMNT_0028403073 /DNA_START=221 /DNA_END=451 /DNA_ORIENTATION=+